MKKFFLTIVVLAIAGGVVAYVLRDHLPGRQIKAAEGDTAPQTIKVGRSDIDLRVATTGKLVSNLDVEIKSKASGQIISLPFEISDKVTSGQLLAELDPVDEKRNVSLREASLLSAKARLAQAMEQYNIALVDQETQTSSAQSELTAARIKYRDSQARMERAKELFQKKLISSEEMDAVHSESATAENSLLQAQTRINETKTLPRTVAVRQHDILLQQAAQRNAEVELENALQRLRETKIYASMDGVITGREVQTGQIIASGISNVGGGTTLMTLSDLSRLFVSANVDESDIGKVKTGQRATITADAYPGRRFRGEVIRISPKGVTNSNVVTFEVKIEVLGEDRGMLKPEMTANVEVAADRRDKAVVLPNEVVQFGKEGYYVELPDGPDKTKRQSIKTGLTDGLNTEVLEGVAEGQEVALPTSVNSRWARSTAMGQGGQSGQSGQSFNRGAQMAAYRLSGAGSSGRSSGGGGGRR